MDDDDDILLSLLQFQQLKQQQLMQQQQRRGLKANNNKTAGHVNFSPSAWSNQPHRRDGSRMRAVFLGDRTGKPRSTGTGVFLPRRVNHTSHADAETREKLSKVSMILSLIYFGSGSDCSAFWDFSSCHGFGSG